MVNSAEGKCGVDRENIDWPNFIGVVAIIPVTFKAIAERLGVAPSTVSKAINDRTGVSAELRKRILAEIEKMGLQPVGRTRLALEKKITKIGLVIGDSGHGFAMDPFYSLIIQGAVGELQRRGLQVIYSTQGNDDGQDQKLLALVEEAGSDGLLLIGADFPSWLLTELRQLALPVVLVDHAEAGMNSVNTDNYFGALQAMEHLFALGHRQIIHLAGPQAHRSIALRLNGYKRALTQAGLSVDEKNIVFCSGLGVEQGYHGLSSLALNHPFTAVFASNDKLAIGALQALSERGCKVPDDVSVVGFDDIEWGEHTSPPLTTVRVAKAQTGVVAAKLLIGLLDKDDIHPLYVQIATELVERRSTKPI